MNCRAQNIFDLSREHHERSSHCKSCIKKALCPAYELVAAQQADSGSRMVQPKTFQLAQTVFSAGDQFDGIYMVRSGFFKSYFIDSDGVMQVTGFHFPGEIFGLDGIETGHYCDDVEALDTGSVCKIPLSLFADSSSRVNVVNTGSVNRQSGHGPQGDGGIPALMKIMSRNITRNRSMIYTLGKMCARRRLAAFLLDLSARMAQSGYDSNELRMCMSRTDISNYLCLALETISRLFTQLHAAGIINVDRRNMKILDRRALQALVHDEPAAKPLLA